MIRTEILRQLPHNSLANWPERVWRPPVMSRAAFLIYYAGVSSAERNCAECPREGTAGKRILGLKLSERVSPAHNFCVGALFLLFGSFLLFLKTVVISL